MSDWTGRKVLVLGAARQGLALARFLCRRGALVTLNDRRLPDQLQPARQELAEFPIRWALGDHDLHWLDGIDLVCISGGVPLTLPIVEEAQKRHIPLSNDSQIFLDDVSAQVIGITGSAGKTTTVSLMGEMARQHAAADQKVWVGGNIGLPLVDMVDEISPQDIVVLELSSFQLELMTRSPHIAAVLNITPNHLDRHVTLDAYSAAKARIIDFQTENDITVLDREDPGSWALAPHVPGKLISFGLQPLAQDQAGTYLQHDHLCYSDGANKQEIMPVKNINLRGVHNQLNVLAACAVASAAGFSTAAMARAVAGFNGVAHRLEWVRTLNGVKWYNDSIATAPERTAAAIHSFDEPLVLLLGGRDKNLPWEDLAALIHQRVDHVVVFGEATDKILAAIGSTKAGERPFSITHCQGLQEATLAAARAAQPGDIVLLSPGGTSYDEFVDFEERGKRFSEWVHQLS
jgi:UDP-N-acetylmuramoylalanine--D-glutamate ligase